LALSVPLSRFTSRVGGGSAFYVRPLAPFGSTRREVAVIVMQIHAHPSDGKPEPPDTLRPSVFESPLEISRLELQRAADFDGQQERPRSNKSPEPTGIVAAVYPRRSQWFHIVSCRWLSFLR
jgi:hypothetical protein